MLLDTKDLALVCCFASLTTVLSSISLFPVIGTLGKFITMAVVLAPLIGLILGPYLGTFSVSLGGFIGWSLTLAGPFKFLSFVPAAAATFCSGLLYSRRRLVMLGLYSTLLLTFALYPVVGPAWLLPYFIWFHLVGLIVAASPLMTRAIDYTHRHSSMFELSLGIGTICFVAVLFGHVVGSTIFEIMYWPTIHQGTWLGLVLVYPAERTIVTILALLIGVPLIKALRAYRFEIGGRPKKHATPQIAPQAD